MKYDKDTMNSLQEAYASVNEEKYYKGDDRDPNTGFPKGIKSEKNKKVKQKRAKRPNYEGSTAGSDLKDIPEEQDLTGITLKQKKQLERQEQLKKASKKAPTYKNKIVPMKTRIEEAIEMTQQEYARTNQDFKSDDPKNPRVTRYVPGKGTVSTPVKIVKKKQKTDDAVKNEGVDKKKEMEDKMKEVEDMRSLPTRMNLIKTKLRAMGLNMSHQLKGKELSEVIDYTLNELNRYERETGKSSGSVNMPKGTPTQKGGDTNPVMRKVRTSSRKGRPEGQQKKEKAVKTTAGTNKFLNMQNDKREYAAKAKKAGFKSVQDYTNTMAIYGGEDNYKAGRGLGS